MAKRKLVIIEGADRTAKSTFVQQLEPVLKDAGFNVFSPDKWAPNSGYTWDHYIPIEKTTERGLENQWLEYKRLPAMLYNMTQPGDIVIKDRFAMSWRIFGEVCRPDTSLPNAYEIQTALEKTMAHYFDVLQIVVVPRNPDRWYKERPDTHKTHEQCFMSSVSLLFAATELKTVYLFTDTIADWHQSATTTIQSWLHNT